jgi:hypothetical protein
MIQYETKYQSYIFLLISLNFLLFFPYLVYIMDIFESTCTYYPAPLLFSLPCPNFLRPKYYRERLHYIAPKKKLTQRIERLWRSAKRRNKIQCGTHRHHLRSHIDEFLFRRSAKINNIFVFRCNFEWDYITFMPPF